MQKQIVQILDYGVGNLSSVCNMISKCGGKPLLVSKAAALNLHEKIILPGVGHYCIGIENLRSRGFDEVLKEAVYVNKVPFLGICLGMQLLFDSSEEGNGIGLGFISGKVKRFSTENNPNLKIPHMGWNTVKVRKSCALANIDDEEMRFYFVHSYYASCQNEDDILMTTKYGNEFVSAVNKDNIYGAQFHPEKSHRFGIGLFTNFLAINNSNTFH
jgi:glutamine amidotransferase